MGLYSPRSNATPSGVKYATSVQEEGQEGIQLHDVIPLRSSRRGRRPDTNRSVPGKAYPATLATSPAKYRDLVSLVDNWMIPQDRHQECKNMKSENTVPDELAETGRVSSFQAAKSVDYIDQLRIVVLCMT